MPRRHDGDDDEFDFDPEAWVDEHGEILTPSDMEELTEDELDQLVDYLTDDFPELDYLDDLDNLGDDDDFYSTK